MAPKLCSKKSVGLPMTLLPTSIGGEGSRKEPNISDLVALPVKPIHRRTRRVRLNNTSAMLRNPVPPHAYYPIPKATP